MRAGKRMKRICLVVGNTLPVPAVMGGAVEELITMLLDQNEIEQKAEFIVFSKENVKAQKAAEKYKHSRIIYIPNDTVLDKVDNRIRRYASFVRKPGAFLDSGYYRKIYRILETMEYDAIVCEGGLYHEFRQFAAKFGKEKTYLHIHHHVLAEPAYDEIFGNIIAVSGFARNEWMRTTKQEKTGAYVVYNCVNEAKFNKKITEDQRDELRTQLGIKKEDFVILYCGRIQEVKGVRELLQAFAKVKEDNCKLLIIGNADFAVNTKTPFLQEVEELVQKDTDRIKFTGYIENAELYKYYQCADMQVVPSMWEEAAGLVAIEGMISGLPLVVTKSGGLIEYAPSDVAMQIDRDGIVENLKDAICQLRNDPGLREEMHTASVKRAADFSRSIFYHNYLKVFDETGSEETGRK